MAGDDSLAEAEKVASFNRLFNEDLRKHIKRGDPNAEAMMRSESIAEKYTYLQTYCLDGRTFEEVQAHRRCKPQLKLVSDG